MERYVRRFVGLVRSERSFFLLAIVIGVTAGLAVVAFRRLIVVAQNLLLGPGQTPGPWRAVLVPTAVGLVLGVLVMRLFPKARGSGVNQTKAALYIFDGYISFRTVIGKFLTAALSIGSGQSLGPEDPSLQMGAGLASLIGRRLGVSRARQRMLAPLGAAAGLAAAFNTPIAAVLFVIEEVVGRWSSGVMGAVVLAAVAGALVARLGLGDTRLFQAPRFELRSASEMLGYAVLGVVVGIASLAFVKGIGWLRPRLMSRPRGQQYFLPAAAGLCVGTIGIWLPQVMGQGYGAINAMLAGHFAVRVLLALLVFKLVATTLSFSSGAPGGMFAPTLFLGAAAGAAVGGLQRWLLPGSAAPEGVYGLVGMGAAFAGILRAPMTSVFIVIELSGSYDVVLPLMLTNTIAYVISRRFQPIPIFDLLTRQEGLLLPSMEEKREEEALHVENAMRPPSPEERSAFAEWADGQPRLYPDQPLEAYLREHGHWPFLPVVHRANGQLLGVVTLEDVLGAYGRPE